MCSVTQPPYPAPLYDVVAGSRGETTMPPVLVTSLRAASKRTAAGAKATFLVPTRAAAVPAARAATAQNAPALLADTGAASATRFQASLRASSAAHARKTNGVPDEPPREMRTCA